MSIVRLPGRAAAVSANLGRGCTCALPCPQDEAACCIQSLNSPLPLPTSPGFLHPPPAFPSDFVEPLGRLRALFKQACLGGERMGHREGWC